MKDVWKTVHLEQEEFRWQLRHGWVLEAGRRLKGVSVAVAREPGRTRELIVDFDFSVFGIDRSPSAAEMVPLLLAAVRSAITAGWQPDSRGRAFRFDWPEEPSS